jgi:hypothetical protein
MTKKNLNIILICSMSLAAIIIVIAVILIYQPIAHENAEIIGTFTMTVDGGRVQPTEITYQAWHAFGLGEPPPIRQAARLGDSGFSVESRTIEAAVYRVFFDFDSKPKIIFNYLVPDRWRGTKIDITVEIENGEAIVKVEYTEKHSRGTAAVELLFSPGEMIWVEFGSHE